MDDAPVTEAELAAFSALLNGERRGAADQVERLRSELGAVRDARSDGTADDEHDPEGPTMSQHWSQVSGLLDAARRDVAAVDAALQRIADGRFGVCLSCGQAIARGRLHARPTAELCIDCARRAG